MTHQEAVRHHFVPKFLLRPWLVGRSPRQSQLNGYWWDTRHRCLVCKRRGLNSFCFQIDLLALRTHHLGRDAIERIFFGEIDTKGAAARELLLEHSPERLTGDQRCDFARLLLSLDVRRPGNVERIKNDGRAYLASELDADPEIRAAMAEHGIDDTPASYIEAQLGWSLDDHALTIVQKLVDNPAVGGRLINAHWGLKQLRSGDGSLVLSDRPLIRLNAYDHPSATWVLPLTPTAAFVATNHQQNLARLLRLSGQRFVKATNVSSASQAERFVFSVEDGHAQWLSKYLCKRT